MRVLVERAVTAATAALASLWGVLMLQATLILGTVLGGLLSWGQGYLLGFNLYISILTAAISLLVLYVTFRSGKAITAMLEELILAVREADNRYIGLENRSEAEIDAAKDAVEAQAAMTYRTGAG